MASIPDNEAAIILRHPFEDLIFLRLTDFFEKIRESGTKNAYDLLLPLFERPLIKHALTACGGNKVETARMLGINRNTLLRKMKTHGMPTQPRFWRNKS